ncbi:SEC14-like protein 1 [Planococcus citri]|uniref:SEC14-like protein 1 n=1 Tax=Planococcus citri TaxID=170843 RepID=UPI0031F86AB8
MVLQYESPVRVYKYPFELVMAAYERRFPTCVLIPVFIGSEILSEWQSPDGSQKITERRCQIHVDAPYLLKKLVGVDYVFFHQKNDLNLKNRTLDIEVKNESFTNRITLMEKCRYYVHAENSEWTCYEQAASLEIHSFFGFESTIEKLAMKQYSQNVATGKEVIEHFIKELKNEGVTFIAPWKPSEKQEEEVDEKAKVANGGSITLMNEVTSDLSAKLNDSCRLKRQGSISPTGTCDNQLTLEADYIKRYLGDLTPLQESKLVQLKKSFVHSHKGKLPSDSTLLRFLRARDFNLEKARDLLSHSLIWRKKHNVDQILSDYQMPQVISEYFPGGWHHYDKDSRPLYILRLGQTDVKGLLKSVGENGLLKLAMHVCEEGLKLTEEATRVSGLPVTTWSLLIDLEGLNMRHYWRPGIRALLHIIEIVEANYPETLGHVLIVRAPRVFPILWTIISTFIDERTRTKFLLYGGNDYQEEGGLADYIDPSIVPDFLGGPCETKIREGGHIPKSLYLPESELEKEGVIMGENSIYSSFSLHRGQVFEVVIRIKDVGTVITWDFDVMRQDVVFTIYRISKEIDLKDGPASSPGSEQKSIIDRSWKEGEDYEKVENSFVCHDGESVQGSHVTQFVAVYILQWKYAQIVSQLSHEGSGDCPRSSSSHKAQIMYFYELLHSADYRGSMTSLQSAQSGFSALSTRSAVSHAPSR